jgi:hypothetical protein
VQSCFIISLAVPHLQAFSWGAKSLDIFMQSSIAPYQHNKINEDFS